ncbi:MAG: translation initiation factor [Patescibacteria group bacterium]|jgi:translation initiation factor IF-2|nr:translation initiation factor [Patescibacteria group bacterium]
MEQHTTRPPIVAVVGHIDHGKSTLLDYIRKTNVVAGEAGGITQHLSAYEATHNGSSITFLDTPGHEAFRAMRSRGLTAADVAILVVSAEDGVKPQTLEALSLISEAHIPYIVALTKVDKPGANIERTKMSLLENGVYLEGLGGEVPWVAVSSKSGEGIPELLDLILLAAELEGLDADPEKQGSGLVIEAHVDGRRGNTATLIVKDGSVRNGEYVICGEALAPVRIMENFLGKNIQEARPGQPIRIVGFSSQPEVGSLWRTIETKKEAEAEVALARTEMQKAKAAQPVAHASEEEAGLHVIVPLVIKTDFAGTGDAVVHELRKIPEDPRLEVRVVSKSVGSVTENDVRLAGSSNNSVYAGIIAGFNVKVEREARDLAERLGVSIATFDIIYELTQWLSAELIKRHPQQEMDERVGLAKILKIFSNQQGKIVLGGRLEEGTLSEGMQIKLMRNEQEVGRGEMLSIQIGKSATKKIEATTEFGAMLKLSADAAPGDHLEAFERVVK